MKQKPDRLPFTALQRENASYPFEQAWGVNVQGTAAFDPVGGAVLTGLFIHHVTRHKHGDEVTGGEPALVGLKEEGEPEM